MPVIKTLKNGVWTKVSSFGELATATSSLNGLMSSADKSKLDNLNSLPTPIPITPTKSGVTNYDDYGNSWYYKIGTRVHVHIGVQGLTPNAPNGIGVLPQGYLPYTLISVSGQGGLTYTAIANITIRPNGNIDVHSADQYACIDVEYDAYN